jgi:crotonobetainyl-CoA:carnitine CoA-transferase CaiB-like acyl-CoA transferase
LPVFPIFMRDSSLGKRATYLDLVKPGDAEQLRNLARTAHVFVDSYRPGALAGLGFTPAAFAHSAPGIVYCAVSCYGQHGPWAGRRGWDEVAQSATGIAFDQGLFAASRWGSRREVQPALLPAPVLSYITGYLGAAGIAAALLRRFREGGSWLVEVSLAATAMWLQSLGKVAMADVPEKWDPAEGLDAYWRSCETERGRLDFLGPVVRMSETPPHWRSPPPEPSADQAVWLPE